MRLETVQGGVDGMVADWCAANGFGSDPVTVSTFTGLINSLIQGLPAGRAHEYIADSTGVDIDLTDEDLFADAAVDGTGDASLLAAFARKEDAPASRLSVAPDRQSVQSSAEQIKDRHSSTAEFFVDASGDWRTFFDGEHWWVIGHHLVFPSVDQDRAEKLLGELSKEELRS